MLERSAASRRRRERRASFSWDSSMRFRVERYSKEILGLLGAALLFAVTAFAQRGSTPTWPHPLPSRQPIAAKDKKPAPRRSLIGMWGAMPGTRQVTNQSSGVQLKPNNGRPENQVPYTPHGLELFKASKRVRGCHSGPP